MMEVCKYIIIYIENNTRILCSMVIRCGIIYLNIFSDIISMCFELFKITFYVIDKYLAGCETKYLLWGL